MKKELETIRKIVLDAADKARRETQSEPEPETPTKPSWPIDCTVGPGLEGAIACESRVGSSTGQRDGWYTGGTTYSTWPRTPRTRKSVSFSLTVICPGRPNWPNTR